MEQLVDTSLNALVFGVSLTFMQYFSLLILRLYTEFQQDLIRRHLYTFDQHHFKLPPQTYRQLPGITGGQNNSFMKNDNTQPPSLTSNYFEWEFDFWSMDEYFTSIVINMASSVLFYNLY